MDETKQRKTVEVTFGRQLSKGRHVQFVVPMGLRGHEFVIDHATNLGCTEVVEISLAYSYSTGNSNAILEEFKSVLFEEMGGHKTFSTFLARKDKQYPLLVIYDFDAVLFSGIDEAGLHGVMVELEWPVYINVLLFSSVCLSTKNLELVFIDPNNIKLLDVKESVSGPIKVGSKRYDYADMSYPSGLHELRTQVAEYSKYLTRVDVDMELQIKTTIPQFVEYRDCIFNAQNDLRKEVTRLLYGSLCCPIEHLGGGKTTLKVTDDEQVALKWGIVTKYLKLLTTKKCFSKESLLKLRNGLMVALNVLFRSYTVWNQGANTGKGIHRKAIERQFEDELFQRLEGTVHSWQMKIQQQIPCGRDGCLLDIGIRKRFHVNNDVCIEISVNKGAQRDMEKLLNNLYWIPNCSTSEHDRSNPFVIIGIGIFMDATNKMFNFVEVDIAVGHQENDDHEIKWTFCPTTPSTGQVHRKCFLMQPDEEIFEVKNFIAESQEEVSRSQDSSQRMSEIYSAIPKQPGTGPSKRRNPSNGNSTAKKLRSGDN